jgi:hypothetical protein
VPHRSAEQSEAPGRWWPGEGCPPGGTYICICVFVYLYSGIRASWYFVHLHPFLQLAALQPLPLLCLGQVLTIVDSFGLQASGDKSDL